MKTILSIFLIYLIKCMDLYEQIINEKVSEEYCNSVLSNLTSLIKETYVYYDFLKAPKQPEGYEDYIQKIDIITKLNEIDKKDRYFYDFYRDIKSVLGKTGDGHLQIIAEETPNKLPFSSLTFCVPFFIYPSKNYSAIKGGIYKFVVYTTSETCFENYSEETINQIKKVNKKNIAKINGKNVTIFLDEMSKKLFPFHSPQARYIKVLDAFDTLPAISFPFKKEEFNRNIEFEPDGEQKAETLEISYNVMNDFFLSGKNRHIKNNISFQSYHRIENKFKYKEIKDYVTEQNLMKNGIFGDETTPEWDIETTLWDLKCKVDHDNKLNILYQNSFEPSDYEEYENVMYACFEKFYSNDYKIIIIENKNKGGKSEICVPFSSFINLRRARPLSVSMKSTETIKQSFWMNDESVNPDTCKTITEEYDIMNGGEDIYSEEEGITHKKTKSFEPLNIFEKKIMELKRKEYIKKGFSKKPTEVIIFTDGYSFSCTSIFIKSAQLTGSAIIAGYNPRSDFSESNYKFDASQSNSGVENFDFTEQTKNLNELGFEVRITFTEMFDPNDKRNPKIPMEFQIYPVDEISEIYGIYDDGILYRFINEAKAIFKKYNEKGQCNPENKYLYYETDECDSVITVEHGHGGYLCGSDGKWDKNNCIVAYCDDGFILNEERTKCIEDPCEKIELKEIDINDENRTEYIIEPNKVYIFTIINENHTYYFKSNIERFFHIYDDYHVLKTFDSSKISFTKGDKIYVNYFLNITNNATIIVKTNKDDDEIPEPPNDKKDGNNGLSLGIMILIIISSILVISIIIIIIVFVIKKKKNKFIKDLEQKNEDLVPEKTDI